MALGLIRFAAHRETAFNTILRRLIEECGADLHLQGTEDEKAVQVGVRAKLPARQMRMLWSGETRQPNEKTRDRLFEFFKGRALVIEPEQFTAPSWEAFRAWGSRPDRIILEIPGYSTALDRLEKYLSGIFIAYKYPFDGQSEDFISREVLFVWREESVMKFRMSFIPTDTQQITGAPEILECVGSVLHVDKSLMFWGISNGKVGVVRRMRSLIVCDELGSPQMKNAMFGILSSTLLFNASQPCSACTVMVRVQNGATNVAAESLYEALKLTVTRTDNTLKLLKDDFGTEDGVAKVRLFLDNRPNGTARDPGNPNDVKLMEIDRNRSREPVMRLNLNRFQEMTGIVDAAIADTDLVAPFKANWPGLAPIDGTA